MRRPRGARAAGTAAAGHQGRTGGAEQPQQHVAAPERDDGGHHDRRQTPHQWCDQDTGETASARTARRTPARGRLAGGHHRQAAQTVSPRTAEADGGPPLMKWCPRPSPRRARAPRAFWLVLSVASPIRSVAHRRRPVLAWSPQASAKPGMVAAANEASATSTACAGLAAARNTAGTPPASASARSPGPPRIPVRGHGVAGQVGDHQCHQDHADLGPEKRWPGWLEGSCPAPPCPAASQPRRSHGGSPTRQEPKVRPSRVSTIHIDTSNSRQVTTLIATLAACKPHQRQRERTRSRPAADRQNGRSIPPGCGRPRAVGVQRDPPTRPSRPSGRRRRRCG